MCYDLNNSIVGILNSTHGPTAATNAAVFFASNVWGIHTKNITLRQLSVDESVRLWEWLPLSPAIINAVTDMFTSLPPHVFLRTGDAVHLLSARINGFAEIYSNDTRLLAAASHIDMAGHDVIEQVELPGGAV